MKIPTQFTRFPIVVVLGLVVFSACQKQPPPPPTTEVEATPEPERRIAVTATPKPEPMLPVATPPPATPQPNYLAPEGVFFLIAAVSVETADGIAGLRPGTRAISQPDGRYLADGHLVALRADQITNDLRIARQVAGADQNAQAAIRQSLQASTPPPPAADTQQTPQRTQRTQSTRGQPAPAYVPGVNTQSSGLQSSTALGGGHTRTDDGYLWQKSPDGQWWVPVKRLNGKPMGIPPSRRKVQ